MIKQRIKIWDDKDNDITVGYMIADVININYVAIGVSVCHSSDKFDREIGELLAYHRIYTPYKQYKIKNYNKQYGMRVQTQVQQFIERCSRYYKDKAIILPRIEYI